VVLMAFSFLWAPLFYITGLLLCVLFIAVLVDAIILFHPLAKFSATRWHAKVLSLGDENTVALAIKNNSRFYFWLTIIDELPMQLQVRNFQLKSELGPLMQKKIPYTIRPTERGVYQFGDIRIFIRHRLGLLERLIILPKEESIACYPSVIQMKKYELKSFQQVKLVSGIKKIRKLGSSYEFEQIKEYVLGDDYRSVNWKATGKLNRLMVDQYEDEKSQQVYCIIDKSRNMVMPFNGLSLLDYAINATLCLSNIALQKEDKVGLITFADKIDALLKGEKRMNQLSSINELLYKQKEESKEANFELLYQLVRYFIKGRSLIILFTNFESSYALKRVLPILRQLNKLHLLVVVFFENTALQESVAAPTKELYDVYKQTLSATYHQEKFQFLKELNQYGINALVTSPEDLTANTINKYLALKAKRLI